MNGLLDLVVEALENCAKTGVIVCFALIVVRIAGQFLWGW